MFAKSLSGRFLLLTIVFIMLAEVFIFVPSISRFRYDFLTERMERSQIASLSLLASSDQMIEPELESELLDNAGVMNISLRRDAVRELVLARPMPSPISKVVDLRENSAWQLIMGAFDTIVNGSDRVIQVVGAPVKGGGMLIEAAMPEKPLRNEMIAYGLNILLLSAVISIFTAALLNLAVRRFLVGPINRVVGQIQAFQSAPEDARSIIEPSASVTELFEAEKALQSMETDLNQSLRQKERLAALGSAVSKISHDLRNILTTTQLLADRMEMSDDPRVQRTAPKLVNSLSRAVNLCERTLAYGKAEEPAPTIMRLSMHDLVMDVVEAERLALDGAPVTIDMDIDPSIIMEADSDQIYRVIGNLVRNARQVLSARKVEGTILVTGAEETDHWTITVQDDGPGMPEKALKNLFTAFQGGARAGGSGLGLAISAELVRGHGGALEYVPTDGTGARFEVTLPR